MVRSVVLSDAATKRLRRVPQFIAIKLAAWIEAVEVEGLESVRRIPGFHDEPLHGTRRGQRSIRLSKAYRAIYVIVGASPTLVRIEEVHKHDY